MPESMYSRGPSRSRTPLTLGQPSQENVFTAWKCHAELGRGCIFGIAPQGPPLAQQLSAPDAELRWLDAQRIVRAHLLDRDLSQEDTPPVSIPTPTPSSPTPPIRRIHRRFGSWWLWTPVAEAGGAPPRHEWRKLPPQCQAILDEAAAGLRPRNSQVQSTADSLGTRLE